MERGELIKSAAHWLNWFEDEASTVENLKKFLWSTGYLDQWLIVDKHKKGISSNKINRILSSLKWEHCLKFCLEMSRKMPEPALYNNVMFFYDEDIPAISIDSRKEIIANLPEEFCGSNSKIRFLRKYFFISPYQNYMVKDPEPSVFDQLIEIVDQKNEWSYEKLFERIGAFSCATRTFRKVILGILDPNFRTEEENTKLVKLFNEILIKDSCALVPDKEKSKYRTRYKFTEVRKTTSKAPQRLIFGAKGVKPNFGITDVIDGDINLVANDGEALIYDQKIEDRLNWSELLEWWEDYNLDSTFSLEKRLIESLDSEPEILFFKAYFQIFYSQLSEDLPALIPQVYVAYDPVCAKDLPNGKTRIRQRIDFLMILPNLKRVVIEIDGKHHYAREDGRADTKRYADMVRVDRDLRLRGYEVYRFGGAEFYNDQNTPEDNAVSVVKDFFTALFKQHEIL
ncbi:hypothetical protein [Acinetobacter indicus]|uniref:AbiJ-related protein n=1 Tax=Acinetobacter indicus TaxID=756892 RepID=UPI002575ACDE|nr:hypothetical protein [Acinetobacter indicus]MDM1287063.1 hypothetical protein [Acinetobacter indicus]